MNREAGLQAKGEAGLKRNAQSAVAAHWRFRSDQVLDGSLEEWNMRIKDLSGNGNELESVHILPSGDREPGSLLTCLQWEQDPELGEVLAFRHDGDEANKCYFRTVAEAPLNTMTFTQGYTIEAVVQLPHPFDEDKHSWMGVLTRQGSGAELGRGGERELLATLSVSNCMEYQWVYHPDSGTASATSWSRYLKEKEWHHVVIVNDTQYTLLYVNGICDFSCLHGNLRGLAAVEEKGWNVGASEWQGRLDTLFSGKLSEIRIANSPLPQSEWLANRKPLVRLQGDYEGTVALRKPSCYHFVFVPDPQKLVYLNPHMFHAQVEWVKQSSQVQNIAMTAFLGDVVDHSDAEDEWNRAALAISKLDLHHIPYLMTAGNHDYDEADTYLAYFGPHRFKGKSYIGDFSPSNYSSYGMVQAGSYMYLWLMVDMKHLEQDLAWCAEVLRWHREHPTIIISHDIVFKNGEQALEESEKGKIIWEQLVFPWDQVFMTVNGHYDGTGHQVRSNANDLEVIQLLVNYQGSYRGGNGWLRLAEFDEEANQIRFCTYSPWVEQLAALQVLHYPDYRFLTGEDHAFTLSFSFKERFGQL